MGKKNKRAKNAPRTSSDKKKLDNRKPGGKSRLPVIAGAALAAIALVALAFALLWPRQTVLAFYRLDAAQAAAILRAANAKNPEKPSFSAVTLDPDQSLEKQRKTLSRASALFLHDGAAAAEFATAGDDSRPMALPALSRSASPALLALMPSAVRNAGSDGKNHYALPVLLDHFELAWNRKLLSRKGFGKPDSLEGFEAAARAVKAKTVWPISCAGAVDDDLAMFVGSVIEAVSGADTLEAFARGLQTGENAATLAEKQGIAVAFDTLARWRREGLLHPEWLNMDAQTVKSLMESDATAFAFMTLSAHRTVDQKTIEKYESAPMPASGTRTDRAFVAPAIAAVRLDAKRNAQQADSLLATLAGAVTQKALSDATGLAPVNSTAETRDRQASDVRLWVASSRKPMANPLDAAFADPADRARAANDLREWLRSQ